MGFQQIGSIIPRTPVDRAGVREQMLAARVVDLAGKMLERLWPDERARYIRIASFAKGELVFETSNGAAAQALGFQVMQLQNAINHELQQKIVQKTIVRLKA